MAKFDAGAEVEGLEFDFTAFGGPAGRVQEPSSGAVQGFFNGMKRLMSESKAMRDAASQVNIDPDGDLSEDDVSKAMSAMESSGTDIGDLQFKQIELIAELCGAEWVLDDAGNRDHLDPQTGSPSFEVLNALPFRVFTAFSKWITQAISPKKTTPGSKA